MILTVSDISKHTFSSIPILKRPRGNQKTRDTEFYYKDVVCAFDIETTRLKIGEKRISKTEIKDLEVAIMYIWQFQVGLDLTIVGRTWEEFDELIDLIDDGLREHERLVIYVHNLAYEFQFLRDEKILGNLIQEKTVFMLGPRKILKFEAFMGKLEFRCSYIHSNMSLDLFTSKMEVEHKKLSGEEFDYNKKRFPWTELSKRELEYCVNDVIGLVEAIVKEMAIDGDNLYTIPLTSTGYVRRDIKSAIHEGLPKTWVKERKPDYDTYKMLHEAFRGGNTHASRFNSNKIIGKNGEMIWEYDRSSSYPDVQLNGKFPIEPFKKPKYISNELYENAVAKGYAVIGRVWFKNLKIKGEEILVPYISKSKCNAFKITQEDNGRILCCDYAEMCITEIDLAIILSQYDFTDYGVIDFRMARKGDLPEPIKEVIRKYYRLKTELKGNEEKAIIYMKSKNKLNAIYGNSAQDPGKINILYRKGNYVAGYYDKRTQQEVVLKNDDEEEFSKAVEELHRIIYESSNTVLPYQFGVYTTALARYELQKMIDICGKQYIYGDTDSVYFVQDGTVNFDDYNKRKIELSKQSGAFAVDSKGITHYMGVAECERDDIVQFKTLGAKKYAYITRSGKVNVTTSGVNKRKSPDELQKSVEAGESILDVYAPGFIFDEAGGNEIEYIDYSRGEIEIDGRMLYVPTCAVIRPSTYKLGLDGDYSSLLDNPKFLIYSDIMYNVEHGITINTDYLL